MTPPGGNHDPEGEDLLPLSALNDLLYCPRRCWLHFVAGLDEDNACTMLGKFDHERADEPAIERRPGVRIERALPLQSRTLGLVGRADVVEFRITQTDDQAASSEIPFPIEYKHGPKRQWDNDDVQLCAQALCLEEMLGVPVPAGAVFHVSSKRRREVTFTETLRQDVRRAVAALRPLMRMTQPPPAGIRPQCEGCSLRPHCLPEADDAAPRIRQHLETLFDAGG
ncbi:MAG: CRISPR-associated protein Cas4 [Phycisphaerae bacterium]